MSAGRFSLPERFQALAVGLIALLALTPYLFLVPSLVPQGDARDFVDTALALLDSWGYAGHYTPLDTVSTGHFLRTPLYVLLLAMATITGGMQQTLAGIVSAMQWLQIALLSVSVALSFAITRILSGSQRTGLLAAALMIIYAPFLFMTGRLMPETLMITGLLAALWAWLRQKPLIGGLFLALALSTNTLSYWPKALAILILAGGFAGWRGYLSTPDARRAFLKTAVCVIAGGLLCTAGRLLLPAGTVPAYALWNAADTQGWAPLVPMNGMETFAAINGPQAIKGFLEGHSAPMGDILRWLAADWRHALLLAGNNLLRLYSAPENIYRQGWFGLSTGMIGLLHAGIVIAALLSLPMALHNRKLWLLWLLPAVWTLYAAMHIEPRYNLPLMPFLIMAAACGLGSLISAWRALRLRWMPDGILTLSGILLAAGWAFGYPLLLPLRPELPPSLYSMGLLLLAGLWSWLTFARILTVQAQSLSPAKPRLSGNAMAGVFTLLWMLPALCHWLIIPPRTEWATKLGPSIRIHRSIPLPSSFFDKEPMTTLLLLDADPPVSTQKEDLSIRVNGVPVSAKSRIPIALRPLVSELLRPDQIRQYRFIPLPSEAVAAMRQSHQAEITVSEGPEATGTEKIHGDYALSQSGRAFAPPTPDWGYFSYYKSQFDGDGRIAVALPPIAAESTSRLSIHGKLTAMDLSDAPGLQTGQYRILLYRLLPDDAAHHQIPVPSYEQDFKTGRISKTFRLAY